MTRSTFEPGDRIAEYCGTLRGTHVTLGRRVLDSAAAAVRRMGHPSLAATRLDSGVLGSWWAKRTSRLGLRTREEYFYHLQGYFHRLYQTEWIEAYALRHLRGTEVSRGGWVRVRLVHPLQRDIDAYVASLGACCARHQKRVRRTLLDFERFWNGRGGGLSRSAVAAWVRDRLRRHHDIAEGFCVGILRKFLDARKLHGAPRSNPARFPRGVSDRLLAASLRDGRRIRLTPAPDSRTELTAHWRKFVVLKRRLGCRYVNHERLYRAFDRFLSARGPGRLREITADRIESFLCGVALRRRRTFEGKRAMLHVLFDHLAARGVLLSDPTISLRPHGAASPPPCVYTHGQIHALLSAARALPAEEDRGRTWYTMLHLLYACGLRVGELIRLELRDVDLGRRCLLIRQTKFYKDRLVPFNERVCENLTGNLAWRRSFYAESSLRDPVFINRHHRRFSYARFRETFQALVGTAGIAPSTPGQRTSIHALRRTFAVHRLMRWYREAGDVTGKLPLLATYMGHASWEYTRVYLTMTPALMQTAGRRFAADFEATVDEAP